MPRAELLWGREGLQGAADAWAQVQAAVRDVPFYARHEWLAAISGSVADPSSLMSVVMSRAGSPRGVVLLQYSRRGILSTPLPAQADLTDVLLADGEQLIDWWPVLRKAFRAAGITWIAVRIRALPGYGIALRGPAGQWTGAFHRVTRHSCYLDCRAGHDAISAHYAGQLRKTLKVAKKSLSALGEVTLHRFGAGDDRATALAHFMELEASGWKGPAGTGSAIAMQRPMQSFYQQLFGEPDSPPMCEVWLLCVAGRAVAAHLSVVSGDCRSVLKIAHDASLKKSSPGTVLLDKVVAEMCAASDGPKRLSLVTGLPWMEHWHPEHAATGDLWLFRWGWLGTAARAIHQGHLYWRSLRDRGAGIPEVRGG